jgi:hypothetical protein
MARGAIAYDRDDSRHPTLVPDRLTGDDVWYVQVLFPDGRIDHVGVFRDKLEVRDWIAQNSAAWLADYERRRMNDRWDRVASAGKVLVAN